MIRVFRVQDWRGRGPFKPGLSYRWADPVATPGREYLPSFLEEFGVDIIRRLNQPGEHYGCGVRNLPEIDRWFSPTEQPRLAMLGYRIVTMGVDRIVAESNAQILFARRRPLADRVVTIRWDRNRGAE